MITESSFPVLKWTGYKPGTEPRYLRFACIDERGQQYAANSQELTTLVTLFRSDHFAGSTLTERIKNQQLLPQSYHPLRHLYLTDAVAHAVDGNDSLRARLWPVIPTIPAGAGSILCWQDSQYVYRILSVEDTNLLHELGLIRSTGTRGGRWFGVLYLQREILIGVEFGYLSHKGIEITPNGYYALPFLEKADLINLTGIALCHWLTGRVKEEKLQPGVGINKTVQQITVLA